MEYLKNYILPRILEISIVIPAIYLTLKYLLKTLFEHQISKIYESYKFKLQLEFDKISKINQRELEVLSKIWELIAKFRGDALFYTNTHFLTIDLDRLSEDNFRQFLEEIPLPKHFKNDLLKSKNKNQAYIETIFSNSVNELNVKFTILDNFQKNNRIFLTNNIHQILIEICRYFWDFIKIYRIKIDDLDYKSKLNSDFQEQSQILMTRLQLEIQKRIRFTEDEL